MNDCVQGPAEGGPSSSAECVSICFVFGVNASNILKLESQQSRFGLSI